MSKRGENIRKRKDGRWEGRYKSGYCENGNIRYRSVYGKTYRETKEKMAAVREEVNKEVITDKEKCFSDILKIWLENARLTQKGATEYKYSYLIDKHIGPALGNLKLSQINTHTVNLFLDEKLKAGRLDNCGGLSPSYVKTMLYIVRSALNFAVEEKMCQPMKTSFLKPADVKKELTILTLREQLQLEEYLLKKSEPACIGVLLSLRAGLRIGEVCALSWNDIDFICNVIHIRHTISRVRCSKYDIPSGTCLVLDTPKTKNSIRDIPISSFLLPILLSAYRSKAAKYVASSGDSFISPRTFEYRFHKLLNDCGITKINYHALRHTFATRCIEVGMDVKSLSEILGHANVGITLNTYVHSSIDMKRKQLDKLTNLASLF